LITGENEQVLDSEKSSKSLLFVEIVDLFHTDSFKH